jgi:hypothetical protein
MTHNVTGPWALEAVKRLEVPMEDSILVNTICPPEAWVDLMQRYFETLAASEATLVSEEEV